MIPLRPDSIAYSHAAVLHLGDMAALAYEPEDLAVSGALALGYLAARFVDGGISTQVLLASTADHLVAAFRGTEWNVLADWERDGAACLAPGPGRQRVHRGFLRALQEVEGPLEATLRDLGRGRSLWLCGHSLGGALATLAAAYLALEVDRPFLGAYTYGAPRVGGRGFAAAYGAVAGWRTWRISRAGDLVPRLPPRVAGYSHVGQDVFLTAGGRLLSDPGGWLRELSTVEADLAAIEHLEVAGLAEHRMDGYRTALRAATGF